MGRTYSHGHAAVLLAQLPPGSRVMGALDSRLKWSVDTYLLSAIEYQLRYLQWMNSKDGPKGTNKPKPPITPVDDTTTVPTAEHMQAVADALGIKLESGGE